MERKDFSGELFSLKGDPPAYLPSKILLPTGDYRRSCSISLEELQSCGYDGPVCCPQLCNTEKPVWNARSATIGTRPLTDEETLIRDEPAIRAELQQKLDSAVSIYQDPDLSDFGLKAFETYYGLCAYALQRKDKVLTREDVPVLDLPWNAYYSSADALVREDVSFHYRSWQLTYENCAVDDSLHSTYASGYFNIPPSWVIGSGSPYPFMVCPSGELCCYDLTPKDLSELVVDPVVSTNPNV